MTCFLIYPNLVLVPQFVHTLNLLYVPDTQTPTIYKPQRKPQHSDEILNLLKKSFDRLNGFPES